MRRLIGIALAVVALIGSLSTMGLSANSATAAGRILYLFSVDDIGGDGGGKVSGDKLAVVRDVEVPYREALTLRGWFATSVGVQKYEYICTPSGGGAATWQTVPEASIFARNDLTQAHVLYASGHKTAGFDLTIPFSEDMAEGYYDVYIRAVTGDGSTCDFLAFLHLRYGAPDLDDGSYRTISFDRLVREGDVALRGGATVQGDGIMLPVGGVVRLGNLHLLGMELVTIRYTTEAKTESGDRRAILGLKRTGDFAYGALDEPCNMTDSLAYAALPEASSGEITIDLTALEHSDDVWLTGWLTGTVTITEIRFAYNGKGTDRVAAKLYLAEQSTSGYLAGQNAVSCFGITDPTVGDCLRVQVSQDTNDPYVHFSAGMMMEENGIRLNADEYKYLVLLLRAAPENTAAHMTLYLCAGSITSATEACTITYTLQKDGKWHYYLLDLTDTENWRGIINGWRFDIISGNCVAGNAVDIATVQFFRTAQAAQAAATQTPDRVTPYTEGEPAVIPDRCEEGAAEVPYTVPPEDTVVSVIPDTEPPVESVTSEGTEETESLSGELSTETAGMDPEISATASSEDETDSSKRGCAAGVLSGMLLSVTIVSVLCLRKRRCKEDLFS